MLFGQQPSPVLEVLSILLLNLSIMELPLQRKFIWYPIEFIRMNYFLLNLRGINCEKYFNQYQGVPG